MLAKNFLFILFFLFSFLVGKPQKLVYDSLNYDSCKIIPIGKKAYCQCFDRFGRISRQGYMKNNKENGYWEIYSSGNLLAEGNCKNGLKNGRWKYYFVSGKEVWHCSFLNSKKKGTWKIYSSKFDSRSFCDKRFLKLKELRVYKSDTLLLIKKL